VSSSSSSSSARFPPNERRALERPVSRGERERATNGLRAGKKMQGSRAEEKPSPKAKGFVLYMMIVEGIISAGELLSRGEREVCVSI